MFLLGYRILRKHQASVSIICFLLDKFLRCAPKSQVMAHMFSLTPLPARGICHLLVIFDDCLNPDQGPLSVCPDLDLFDTLIEKC